MDSFQHQIQIEVRYSEIDAMGIVHHANYWSWFEMGRIKWLANNGINYRQLEKENFFLPLISASINYRRPLYFNDKITLVSSISRKSLAKIAFDYQITSKGNLTTTAQTQHVAVDENRKPIKFPPKLLHIIPKMN